MLSLFSRDLTVVTLGSGSKGNCTYIGDSHAGVLIDCGISTKQILARLDKAGLAGAPINGVLITHEHSDHVGAARILCNKLKKTTGQPVPFYMTRGTRSRLFSKVVPSAIEYVHAGEPFQIGHLTIDPFPVPHDTCDPVGYRVRSGGVWAGVVTDLGKPTHLVARKLRSLSVAVLEFNHDLEMLLGGPYPWPLKQRVRGSHGHLSNAQASQLLSDALPDSRLQHIVLAHLSEKNNQPQKAYTAAARTLQAHHADHIAITVGQQREPIRPISVRIDDW
ncbi:MAG: MBL fold metallo-hydrolase [Myxococcota bacterium]